MRGGGIRCINYYWITSVINMDFKKYVSVTVAVIIKHRVHILYLEMYPLTAITYHSLGHSFCR